jgi:hypothetical protein
MRYKDIIMSTIKFVGLWEQLNNPDFKAVKFDRFNMEAAFYAILNM